MFGRRSGICYRSPMTKWGDDNLTKFLETAHANQQANLVNFQAPYTILQKINDCMVRAGENLVNPNPVICGVLLLRCQYAYKTAVGLALAGQVVETFTMIRSALEYAGYALVIFEKPSSQ